MLRIHEMRLDGRKPNAQTGFAVVDNDFPLISWGATGDAADGRQTACRVVVGTWDSGWVPSGEQSLRYAGSALPRGERVAVTAEIRDNLGGQSAPFSAYLVDGRVEWRAPWVGADEDRRSETVYLRRDFTVRKPLRGARLYLCGIGYQCLVTDGEPAGDFGLNPAHTDYAKTCQYTVDPDYGERLRVGENCLAVLLGEGWRRNIFGDGAIYKHTPAFEGVPQLTAMIRLDYADGETEWITTERGFEAGRGAHVSNDLFDGERYVEALEPAGWSEPGYVGFAPAKVLPAPGGAMRPMLISPIRPCEEREPIASWRVGDSLILDFGQNIAGVLALCVPPHGGEITLTVSHAEELDDDGDLFTAPLRSAKAEDSFTLLPSAREKRVSPLFTYHGFRYARLSGAGDLDVRVRAVEARTPLELHSTFRCGNALVTRVHELCAATERANMHSILTDCPQRDERQGWMNDATVRFEATPYSFDVGEIFPKVLRDLADAQWERGSISCTAPFVFGANPADPVCSSYLVAGREALMHAGCFDALKEHYEGFKAWEEYLLTRSDGCIVNYSYYGDWAGPAYACEPNDGARSIVTPGEYMSTGYSYFNCKLIADFARRLGRADDEARYAGLADKIRSAMLEKWYDADAARMATGSHACQAFALWLGILPENDAPRAAKALRDDLAACDYRFTTGNLCTRYLLDVLADYGYVDDAWRLLAKDSYPSIGHMIQNEATTVWERFEQKENPGMNSHCHPMYGACDYFLFAYVAGVKPTSPGYETFRVRPYMPTGLLSAQATVETPRGEISVRWRVRDGHAKLFLNVPFGTRASVSFNGVEREVGSGFHVFG